jgi:tRNA threonylcarbamoyladenosine biosynthesis protein TsaE
MPEFRLVYTLEDIDRTAKQFLRIIQDRKHIAFYGGMGVGKTTFITAICKLLGTQDLVSSPTFAIINEYDTSADLPVYHFDFYRINSPIELMDIGFNEYCTSDAYCFIEWPDKANEIITEDFLMIKMEEVDDHKRIITFTL